VSHKDLEKLSLAEIRQLQRDLESRAGVREHLDQIELVDRIRRLIEESDFDYQNFVSFLQQELGRKVVKFQHPDDETLTWAGLGRRPFWLKDLIEDGSGKSKEDFRVTERFVSTSKK